MRLDHTLNHTQTSSRLIYLIDGAVIAFVYFTIRTLGPTRPVILIASLPTILLFVLNALHARLIFIQRAWYSAIDKKLMCLLKVTRIDSGKGLTVPGSTHRIYTAMHCIIAGFLLLVAAAMLLYGFGRFQELSLPEVKKGG